MQRQQLEEEIISLRLQHRFASVKLRSSAEKLDSFLSDYYSAVGDLAQELATTQEKITDYNRKIKGLPPEPTEIAEEEVDSYNIAPREEKLEREVKDLYRKLIKTVHPDVSEEKLKAAEYVLMVNQAYNEKNLQQLVRIDMMLSRADVSIDDLKRQRNQMIDEVFELQTQLSQIRENPVYKLRKKLRMQADGGKMMIEQIRRQLGERITHARRELMNKKLEYLEHMQKRIIA